MYRLPCTASRLGGGSITLGFAGIGVTTGTFDAAGGFAALAVSPAGVADDGGGDFFSGSGFGAALGAAGAGVAAEVETGAGFGASALATFAGFESLLDAGGGATDFTGAGVGVAGAGTSL